MPPPKGQPAWVETFLDALGRCGVVVRAAERAGIDVTGVYNRRNRYPEFRAACERVLAERAARAAGGGTTPLTPLAFGESPSPARGEGLVVGASCDGVKLSRVAASRWSERTEEGFLEELSATANVARAAAAVGFSAASAYKRRLKHPRFADAWEAAMTVGRAQLESHLLVQANQAFDPEALPIAEGAPKVTVGEAISILKHQPGGAGGKGGGRAKARAAGYMDWVTDEDVELMEEAERARASIFEKLARFHEQYREAKLAAGWTQYGEDWIPPGWGPIA